MSRNKKIALARHLEIKSSEVEETGNDDIYIAESEEWLVLTDSEADEAAKVQIRDTLWAFNFSFLQGHLRKGIDVSDTLEASIKDMQGKLCEGANEIIFGMIEDFAHFAEDAVKCDGRGHFLSSYDGEEHEVRVGKTMYLIYRN
jgi:hypothetical protein